MSHHASWDLAPATGGVRDKHAHSWYPTKHGTALPGKWSWRPESFTGRARLQSQNSALKLARHLDGQDHFNSLEISISLRGEEHFWRSRWTQAVPGNPLAFPLEPLEKMSSWFLWIFQTSNLSSLVRVGHWRKRPFSWVSATLRD